jgi:hypothetical protein
MRTEYKPILTDNEMDNLSEELFNKKYSALSVTKLKEFNRYREEHLLETIRNNYPTAYQSLKLRKTTIS